jgi:hypothetical protein
VLSSATGKLHTILMTQLVDLSAATESQYIKITSQGPLHVLPPEFVSTLKVRVVISIANQSAMHLVLWKDQLPRWLQHVRRSLRLSGRSSNAAIGDKNCLSSNFPGRDPAE